MTDDEKRERIETLLLVIKDWCEDSYTFIDQVHDELYDLVIGADNVPVAPRRHWVNQICLSLQSPMLTTLKMFPGLLSRYADPTKYENEVQRRVDRQRTRKGE